MTTVGKPQSVQKTARREFMLFSPPTLGEEEIQEVVDTLRSPWITTGPKTRKFEQDFSAYLGAPGALALNSCTAGLHTALATLGIGPGDEVITSVMTFTATVNVIEHVGATPVLVDVLSDTLNLDPRAVAEAITPRTRAIIPVHYAGHPAEMDALQTLAKEHGIVIIEDAAHALPASYKGRMIGSGTNPVAFSFYATKNLTTAEGGMLTGDPGFLDRARMVSLHGMNRDAWKRYAKGGSWKYDVVLPGFKYNMTDIAAAIGLVQLRRLESFQKRRAEIAAMYNEVFGSEEALQIPTSHAHVGHAWHLYVLRLRQGTLAIDRDEFIEELAARNIGTSVHFIPVHLHPFYRDKYSYVPEHFPVAYGNFQRMLSLPLHPGLTNADVSDVIDAVLDVAHTFRR
jgi:dTDP-4-amino-4,6-dideoxygalactose transaminase